MELEEKKVKIASFEVNVVVFFLFVSFVGGAICARKYLRRTYLKYEIYFFSCTLFSKIGFLNKCEKYVQNKEGM